DAFCGVGEQWGDDSESALGMLHDAELDESAALFGPTEGLHAGTVGYSSDSAQADEHPVEFRLPTRDPLLSGSRPLSALHLLQVGVDATDVAEPGGAPEAVSAVAECLVLALCPHHQVVQ